MPAALMTGPQSSVSALSLTASRSGVEPTTATPSASNRALTTGSASAATVSVLIFCTISGGVLTGTNNPYHEDTSNPGSPDSATVGNSGEMVERCALVTASARN